MSKKSSRSQAAAAQLLLTHEQKTRIDEHKIPFEATPTTINKLLPYLGDLLSVELGSS